MKNNRWKKISLVVLGGLFGFFMLVAQEGLTLNLNGYKYGSIQWQQSLNGFDWSKINGATLDTLQVEDIKPAHYRAQITEGTCLPWYSETYISGSDKIVMVLVNGGRFTMGAFNTADAYANESPVHDAILSSFYISKFEITNVQFANFLNARKIDGKGSCLTSNGELKTLIFPHNWTLEYIGEGWKAKSGYEIYPVVNVTWYGANEFCRWAGGRLPTEAEWEFTASGGILNDGYMYSGSNNIKDIAWYKDNAIEKTNPIGRKTSNELGIFDMSGNVWEWCNDWYGDYDHSEQVNPEGPLNGAYKVFRGGSCYTIPRLNRNTLRYYGNPSHYYNSLGFRLVKKSD